mmetsp:Transcript_8374/g.10471  ORF Transcript_8374/g.10471 Transcript_8374/m.10471 type:complete len:269 (+) Transcript_8374:184-990(+)
MYSPIIRIVSLAYVALTLSLSSTASAFSSSLNKDFDMELQRTIQNIRSFLSLEQKPKYFLRGTEQLCTEVDLGTDFFSEEALKEALELDAIVRTKPKELDFSAGVQLTKEIDERCTALGGSSFSVTFAPDKECETASDGERPKGCENMITIKNFPICLANCICADVAAAKMNDKVTIVRTNGELNDVDRNDKPVGVPTTASDVVESDLDRDRDLDININNFESTSTLTDAPILRATGADGSTSNNDTIMTGILFLAAGILIVATVTLV